MTFDAAHVERLLHAWWIGAAGTTLREEDRKKVVELRALLAVLARAGRTHPLVDVAAGKAYVGLLAAELLGFSDVTVIERDPRRIEACRAAATHLTRTPLTLRFHATDVGAREAWPDARATVVGLHACGPASDAIIDVAIERQARWLFLVPCCYGTRLRQWPSVVQKADALGLPPDATVRHRFGEALVDAERVQRLEAAGFEVEVLPFVAPTITPHNRLFVARSTRSASRMARAEAALVKLR